MRAEVLAGTRVGPKRDHACSPPGLQVANYEDLGLEPVPGEEMTISEDEYIQFNMNLQYYVQVNVLKKKFNEKKAEQNALREWDFDRAGKDCMNRRDFCLAIFQISDAWAKEITVGEISKQERLLLMPARVFLNSSH